MSVDKFRFVSPGVQVAEIDRSGLPAEAPAIGPAIVGRATRGPAMRPVTVQSTAELYEIFGAPSPGGQGGDVWREGNAAAPTHGLYAAEAYLRNNGPVTFVRLMGEDAGDDKTAEGGAGWDATTAIGVYFVGADSDGSNMSDFTASLGAVLYLNSGSLGGAADVKLASFSRSQAPDATHGLMFENEASDAQELTFSMVIENYKGTGNHLTATFNLDPDSDRYIRKVLNTNPHFTNERIYGSDALNYWLGETYESSVEEIVVGARNGAPDSLDASTRRAFCFIAELNGNSKSMATREAQAQVARSGIVFSQDPTALTASYDPENMQKLFRFAANDVRGEWDNGHIKISIANIKAPTNPTVDPYGTFDVLVRQASDTDNSIRLLESFVGLNLNPASPNYISRRIGDKYLEWDRNEKYYKEYGTYNNVSKYIRVEMVDEVDNASTNPALLPAGFYGPPRAQTVTRTASGGNATVTAQTLLEGLTITTASSDVTAGYGEDLTATYAIRIEHPKMVLRQSGTYGVSSPARAFYGIQSQGVFGRRDRGYVDFTRILSSDLTNDYIASSGDTEYSFIFTLDDVSGSATNPVYVSGSRAASTSFRAGGSFETKLLDNGINSFTVPMFAGFDGLDITEPEPFANALITGRTEQNSYELYSARKAIDTIRDPDLVQHNVVAVPGISDPLVTDYLVEMAEERRDTMAIIDIEHDYKPRWELGTSITTARVALPDPAQAVSTMKLRGFDTSYGAAYYPAVQIRDRGSNVVLYAPASVAAMASLGYTDRVSFPWFAPAGFNRGGLSDGSSGIVATGVAKRLTSKERDDLYAVNINPIAQFPQEGVVIFGQKTLQASASALDRVNVRRLLIFVKKEISRIANATLFQPNVRDTWNRFLAQAEPFLDSVKADFGLEDYRLILDETTTTPELIDRNTLYARVLLKPARAIEFIAIDFEIFRSGASFDD